MKRIYLDQWAWVELTKARVGHAMGADHRDVLLIAQAAVTHGAASFPLSSVHYTEIQHIASYDQRLELATTMAELSRYHTMAQWNVIVPAEADRAVCDTFGSTLRPINLQVFGVGAGHAFKDFQVDLRVPESLELPLGVATQLEAHANRMLEWRLLTGPSDQEASRLVGYDRHAHRIAPTRFALAREEHRKVLERADCHKGDRGRRAAYMNAFADFGDPIDAALCRHGRTWDDLTKLGRQGMETFLESMPSAYACMELERLRNEASQKSWEPNDLNDLDALARAIPYCDVVVTEKQWVQFADRAGLGQRNGTEVISRLSDLRELLVTL